MRLIDVDDCAKLFKVKARATMYNGTLRWVVPISEIDNVSTVDAIKVVRCKDCRYHYQTICPIGTKTFDEDFCSYGERRNDE